jgi:hypothetical protein
MPLCVNTITYLFNLFFVVYVFILYCTCFIWAIVPAINQSINQSINRLVFFHNESKFLLFQERLVGYISDQIHLNHFLKVNTFLDIWPFRGGET